MLLTRYLFAITSGLGLLGLQSLHYTTWIKESLCVVSELMILSRGKTEELIVPLA
jgi:hypothetical protein